VRAHRHRLQQLPNRHCPKCQGAAAREWLARSARPSCSCSVFHVVYTAAGADLPTSPYYQQGGDLRSAVQGRRRRPRSRLRARAGIWAPASASFGAAHVGFRTDAPSPCPYDRAGAVVCRRMLKGWIACRPDYFLCVEVLFFGAVPAAVSWRCWSRRMTPVACSFFGDHVGLADRAAFNAYIAPLRDIDWVVYARNRSPDPNRCCAICRAIPIASRSPIAADRSRREECHLQVTRIIGSKVPAATRPMRLDTHESSAVPDARYCPKGIPSHPALRPASPTATAPPTSRKARELLAMPAPVKAPEGPDNDEPCVLPRPCPCCGGRMLSLRRFGAAPHPGTRQHRCRPVITIDTS